MADLYRCGDYPGMQDCPASFTTETEEDMWKHIELHGATAHQEDLVHGTLEEQKQVKELIQST